MVDGGAGLYLCEGPLVAHPPPPVAPYPGILSNLCLGSRGLGFVGFRNLIWVQGLGFGVLGFGFGRVPRFSRVERVISIP